MSTTIDVKDNPFVLAVARKYRNIKKKLEKIAKIEQQQSTGKKLDEEQLILLNSKKQVEKSLQDVASLKTQVEEIATQLAVEAAEAAKNAEKEITPISESTPLPVLEEPVIEPVVNNIEASSEEKSFFLDVETNTEKDEKFASTMTEPIAEPETIPVPPETITQYVPDPAAVETALKKVLKALHVYQRYKDVTSNALPENIDYFGKTLLGQTSITSFPDTLSSSVRITALYLNEESANNLEVVRGVTYAQLSSVIDQLAEEMEKAHKRGGALSTLLINTLSSPTAPSTSPVQVPISVPAQPQQAVNTVAAPVVAAHPTASHYHQPQPIQSQPQQQQPQPLLVAPTFGSADLHPAAGTAGGYYIEQDYGAAHGAGVGHGLQFGDGFGSIGYIDHHASVAAEWGQHHNPASHHYDVNYQSHYRQHPQSHPLQQQYHYQQQQHQYQQHRQQQQQESTPIMQVQAPINIHQKPPQSSSISNPLQPLLQAQSSHESSVVAPAAVSVEEVATVAPVVTVAEIAPALESTDEVKVDSLPIAEGLKDIDLGGGEEEEPAAPVTAAAGYQHEGGRGAGRGGRGGGRGDRGSGRGGRARERKELNRPRRDNEHKAVVSDDPFVIPATATTSPDDQQQLVENVPSNSKTTRRRPSTTNIKLAKDNHSHAATAVHRESSSAVEPPATQTAVAAPVVTGPPPVKKFSDAVKGAVSPPAPTTATTTAAVPVAEESTEQTNGSKPRKEFKKRESDGDRAPRTSRPSRSTLPAVAADQEGQVTRPSRPWTSRSGPAGEGRGQGRGSNSGEGNQGRGGRGSGRGNYPPHTHTAQEK